MKDERARGMWSNYQMDSLAEEVDELELKLDAIREIINEEATDHQGVFLLKRRIRMVLGDE